MRRLAVGAIMAALLALGTGATASASTPGCAGRFISGFAQDPSYFGVDVWGRYVSGLATSQPPSTVGLVDVPTVKYFGCA